MLKLWKNCDVYAPAHLGRRDILMEGGVIAAVEPDLRRWESAPEIEIRDLAGAVVCPGLIDLHVHVTGGGGEQGPAAWKICWQNVGRWRPSASPPGCSRGATAFPRGT